jgi:5-methylcytosine-specific restriction endonuclease McrA
MEIKKKRTYTEEQKRKRSERFKKWYSKNIKKKEPRVLQTDEERRLRKSLRNKKYREKMKADGVTTYYKESRMKYIIKNKDKHLQWIKNWNIKNKERRKLTRLKRKLNKYDEYIIGVRVHSAKRRCSKLQRTPKWLTIFDKQYIRHIYTQARELEKLDGIKRHVDHIIPLQGKTVCGFHVPWNLQILTADENLNKSNKLTVDYKK